MICNCINELNQELAKDNLQVEAMLLADFSSSFFIPTCWLDESKKPKGKDPSRLPVKFCPNCGKDQLERNE